MSVNCLSRSNDRSDRFVCAVYLRLCARTDCKKWRNERRRASVKLNLAAGEVSFVRLLHRKNTGVRPNRRESARLVGEWLYIALKYPDPLWYNHRDYYVPLDRWAIGIDKKNWSLPLSASPEPPEEICSRIVIREDISNLVIVLIVSTAPWADSTDK